MTAALELSRGGAEVVVYEAADRVGGLARSLDLWGQRVDLGRIDSSAPTRASIACGWKWSAANIAWSIG